MNIVPFPHNKTNVLNILEDIDGNKLNLADKLSKIKTLPTYAKDLNDIEINKSLDEIVNIINLAEKVITDNRKEDWDNMIVNKDVKQIEETKKAFQKNVIEFKLLQQRLFGLYDDLMFKLNRYFNFNDE